MGFTLKLTFFISYEIFYVNKNHAWFDIFLKGRQIPSAKRWDHSRMTIWIINNIGYTYGDYAEG